MPDTSNRLALIPILFVGIALIALITMVLIVGRDPEIDALEPRVVSRGDEVVITGRHFGPTIETLAFGSRELPTSSITLWEDDEIRFVVPPNSDSGLLYVVTDRGRSNGVLLQVAATVPRTSYRGEAPGAPVIDEIEPSELSVGDVVTVHGANFGRARRSSRVHFPMAGDTPCSSCDEEYSYGLWSDSTITVQVPSGAASGFLYVVTPWGGSNPVRVVVNRPAGGMVASNPAEIAIRYGARISGVETIGDDPDDARAGERDITLRLPTITESIAQRDVRHLDDEWNQSRFESVDAAFEREVERTVLVSRYELRSQVDPSRLSAAYEAETGFFAHFTRPLPDIPSDDPEVLEIAARLRSGRGSPYRIAEAAYDFTRDTLIFALGTDDRSVRAGLESGYGDDFTYAMLFVSLMRAARVPARPVGGVLVTEDEYVYSHFWAEFFVSGVGWIPVDPSLGDGAFPARFPVPDDPGAYYFGGLDNRRVTFRRGYDAMRPTFLNGVQAVPEDPYTLQRSYAEGGAMVDSFDLEWHTPQVVGLRLSD